MTITDGSESKLKFQYYEDESLVAIELYHIADLQSKLIEIDRKLGKLQASLAELDHRLARIERLRVMQEELAWDIHENGPE